MDAYVKNELYECINELDWIVRDLNDVADDIDVSIEGINTAVYTWALRCTASKYELALTKLKKIK